MDKRQFTELINKYLDGKCTAEEQRMLEMFYNSFQKHEEWDEKEMGAMDAVIAGMKQNIDKRIGKAQRKKSKENKWHTGRMIRVAAVLTFLLVAGVGGWYAYNTQQPVMMVMSEKVTLPGQKSTLLLSDGTQIRLNSSSKLSFPEKFSDDVREVYLEGEAFFDVARDEEKPFFIKTGDLTTRVLGTSFNIKAYPDEAIAVTVATGKVQVSAANNQYVPPAGDLQQEGHPDKASPGIRQSVFLTPHQQATYNPATNLLEKREGIKSTNYLAWKEGEIHFENIKLEEAAKILERWYGVQILFNSEGEDIRHCRINTATYKNENLYNILRSFQYFLSIEFQVIEGSKIILKGEGCGKKTDPKSNADSTINTDSSSNMDITSNTDNTSNMDITSNTDSTNNTD